MPKAKTESSEKNKLVAMLLAAIILKTLDKEEAKKLITKLVSGLIQGEQPSCISDGFFWDQKLNSGFNKLIMSLYSI